MRSIMALLGILLASGLVVGFLDLLRPSDQRTHVGRFFEKVGSEGFSGFSTVIERKGSENAATFSSGIYVLLIVVVIAAGVALWVRPPRPLATAVDRTPTLGSAAISLFVLLVLSYALNDSGLAIPAIMLALVAFTATYLVTRPEPPVHGERPEAAAARPEPGDATLDASTSPFVSSARISVTDMTTTLEPAGSVVEPPG